MYQEIVALEKRIEVIFAMNITGLQIRDVGDFKLQIGNCKNYIYFVNKITRMVNKITFIMFYAYKMPWFEGYSLTL